MFSIEEGHKTGLASVTTGIWVVLACLNLYLMQFSFFLSDMNIYMCSGYVGQSIEVKAVVDSIN